MPSPCTENQNEAVSTGEGALVLLAFTVAPPSGTAVRAVLLLESTPKERADRGSEKATVRFIKELLVYSAGSLTNHTRGAVASTSQDTWTS
jgi:hypothetical protein